MKVFLTGASGWVGSATLPALIEAGHSVSALVRSDEAAKKVTLQGAEAVRGSIESLDVLKEGARNADAVIHLAFIHDFDNFMASVETDKAAIEAIASALEGTDKVFISTSAMSCAKPDELATESSGEEALNPHNPRSPSETFVRSLSKKGVRPAIVRLPPTVHGKDDWGFTTIITAEAKKKGYVAYAGDGKQRWAAIHRRDAAQVYLRALERRAKDGPLYHAVAEGAIEFKTIAEAIAKKHGLEARSVSKDDMQQALGIIGIIASTDAPASSEWTRKTLDWQPHEIGLLEDIRENY